jgi:hypothetical protein
MNALTQCTDVELWLAVWIGASAGFTLGMLVFAILKGE